MWSHKRFLHTEKRLRRNIVKSVVEITVNNLSDVWQVTFECSKCPPPASLPLCEGFNSLVDQFLWQAIPGHLQCLACLSLVIDTRFGWSLWQAQASNITPQKWGWGPANLEATDPLWWIPGSWPDAIHVRCMPYVLALRLAGRWICPEAEDCSLQGVWEEYDRHNMQCRH